MSRTCFEGSDAHAMDEPAFMHRFRRTIGSLAPYCRFGLAGSDVGREGFSPALLLETPFKDRDGTGVFCMLNKYL